MPELPEVETVRQGLEKLIVGKAIKTVQVRVPKMIKTDKETFALDLSGQTIEAVRRRGKYLIFDFGSQILISHLRMEGKYLLFSDQVPENKHFHLFFQLDDGSTLVYQDVRKFGTFELFAKAEESLYFSSKKIGPEPTERDFSLSDFSKKLAKSKKPIKLHLLDQSLVAGLGNIYVDEVLWRARVYPGTVSLNLKSEEISAIRKATIEVLQLGVDKGGSTIRTYQNALGESGSMQNFLRVYGQQGQPCARCTIPIEKIKLGGRGTHYCPRCQKK